MHHSFRRVSSLVITFKKLLLIFKWRSDLVAELPFILMHPKPDDIDDNIAINDGSSNNANRVVGDKHSGNNSSAKDDAPNLIQLDGSVKKEFF